MSLMHARTAAGAALEAPSVDGAGASDSFAESNSTSSNGGGEPSRLRRGLTDKVPAQQLRSVIWHHALSLANRFRVIRTIDVAACCFPERDYKASLTAAQRATRGLVKAGLIRRYRTDRFQTVYGLTQRGADWLHDLDDEAAASVRRVSDMSNPEHRLWSQFLVLTAEARGLRAWTEGELMQRLATIRAGKGETARGLLQLKPTTTSGARTKALRPDALLSEPDGATWLEVDRSARGSDRAADLRGLVLSVGGGLADGQVLRRVVVFTRTERIRRRVLAALKKVAEQGEHAALVKGRRQLKQTPDGSFEVWLTEDRLYGDRRRSLVDRLAGHVVVQELPVWLPKLRLDGRGESSTKGWLGENYLPYRRPGDLPCWPTPVSPLLKTSSSCAG
jgi:hypothetical protein